MLLVALSSIELVHCVIEDMVWPTPSLIRSFRNFSPKKAPFEARSFPSFFRAKLLCGFIDVLLFRLPFLSFIFIWFRTKKCYVYGCGLQKYHSCFTAPRLELWVYIPSFSHIVDIRNGGIHQWIPVGGVTHTIEENHSIPPVELFNAQYIIRYNSCTVIRTLSKKSPYHLNYSSRTDSFRSPVLT